MDVRIGRVTHYYPHIGVAVIELEGELEIGSTVSIQGHTTDLVQQVVSLEINHQKKQKVGPGMEAALKVDEPVRKGDVVFNVFLDDRVIADGKTDSAS